MIAPPRLTAALASSYTIEHVLGTGGMATVYRARDLKHDRLVALKVVRPELAAALGADRFLREVRISARLDHPHILTLIDSGESDGFLWYALPYVRGESLRQKLEREKQLSLADALRITAQIASALDYAHRLGVIHRDVKPENILLHEGEAMLADFGIALAVREAGGERLTGTGVSLGTPQYMSPEQAAGDRDLDARSDAYSLAAVVYEMLAGEPPHTGPTAQAIVARLMTERPTPIHARRDTVPREMDAALARGLSKVPADRFAGAGELAAALSETPAGPPRRRSRLLIAGAVAGAVVLIGIGLWRTRVRPASPLSPVADVASVAVLPFENLTGNPNDLYLSDGMTEEVIGQLTQVRGLKVISRTSTEALRGAHLTLRQIAETLGVRHVLEGSVRHAGNRIRVAVDLIDATSDTHTWASRYDRDLTDVFAVQDEIARNVADSLVSAVGIRPALSRLSHTEAPGAYEAYLIGRSLMYRRTPEGLRGAREQFERAIAQDSSFAPAYAGLAAVYQLWVVYAYSGIDLYEADGRAVAMANRAIALAPDLAEAYAARGRALMGAWGRAPGILADFKRALELQPNLPEAHHWYGGFLLREGHLAEGLAEAERAVALDPVAPGSRLSFAQAGVAGRRYDVTQREGGRALALEPDLVAARMYQALGQLLSGKPRACATDDLGPYVAVRAMCLHSLGSTGVATRITDSLAARFVAGTAGGQSFNPVLAARGLAEYYAWTGNAAQSLTWLQRAYALSPEGEDMRILVSGLYDRVRNDSRFNAALTAARAEILRKVLDRAGLAAPGKRATPLP